jgi:signal transduction histidine kinase/CheY-like chemotaxis protein
VFCGYTDFNIGQSLTGQSPQECSVSGILTRRYLRSNYLVAAGAIIACLVVSIAIGGHGMRDVSADARYTTALVNLMKAENWFQVQLAWAVSGHGRGASGDRSDIALKESFSDFLAAYILMRAHDGSSPNVFARPELAKTDRWVLMAKSLGFDPISAHRQSELDEWAMPASLRDLWLGRNRPGDSLQTMLGDIIARGYAIVSSGGAGSPERRKEAQYINEVSATRLRPALQAALAALTYDSVADAVFAFQVLLSAGLLGVTITGCSVAFVFLPMERSILEAQRMLVRERDHALASESAKRDFLAMMSHELRTPMNGILGFTNLLLSTRLDARQKDYVETIHSSGITLLDLLNDILDISKIEAGSIEPENEEFSIADIVANVMTLLGPRAFAKKLELSAYVDPSLPVRARGDAGRLRQVLINLMANAIKFTEKGGIAIEIRREKTREQSCDVMIAVTDTGIGVAQDQLDRIFERFAQVDASLSRNYEGAGLGLPICKQLIELMGGRIGVESVLGQGSTFWARLTLANVVPPSESILEAAPVDLTGRRLLAVDDSALNLRIFKLQFEGFGASVECASSGRAALEALARAVQSPHPFELAIIDQMMPDMDGVTLRDIIRRDAAYASLKLVLSSSSSVDGAEQAALLGFDAACPKLIIQEKLVSAIHDVLAGRAPEAPAAEAAPAPGAAPAEAPVSAPEAGASEEQPSPRKPRLLVAEDNAANQRLILAVLENAGYIVDIVSDGVEAVRAAQRLPYDLILMDIRMPVMGGIEATRRIRALNLPIANCPILALTANAMVGDREEYLAAGMNDYVSKPIDLKGLVAKIKNYLGDSGSGEQAA